MSCGEKKQWNSHSEIDPLTKDFIRRLRENNVSAGRVCSILGAANGGLGLPVRREVIRSVCAKLAQDNIRDDLVKTMKILDAMKETHKEMEVTFKLGGIRRSSTCCGAWGRTRRATSASGTPSHSTPRIAQTYTTYHSAFLSE